MMATNNLSQNRAAQRLAKYRLAVATLARREATKAIKAQLREQGVNLSEVPVRTIRMFADAYFNVHCERLVAEAKQIIATSPLFERWRWPVANIASDAHPRSGRFQRVRLCRYQVQNDDDWIRTR
jgi:hypothetical protein